jgi:predicted nucleotidyltransferase
MRLDSSIIQFFKQTIKEEIPGARVYLFGSRTNDDAHGGDIDILVLTHML